MMLAVTLIAGTPALAVTPQEALDQAIRIRFPALLVEHPDAPSLSLEWLDANWQDEFVSMALEIVRFIPQRSTGQALLAMVARKTGAKESGSDWSAWMRWQWNRPAPPPSFAAFKASLYANLDPRFEKYFSPQFPALIRLDEIIWGGVLQDGIPPLRRPKMLAARDAGYLADTDVIFGIEINGDPRAYPKRILAWHEMFVDRVGNVDVAGVYCTLCGAVVVYETVVDGRAHELGTSGFLYRSNKLMYDAATQSLWNTLEGRPVVGLLAGKDISLPTREVVTTTWGDWRRRHPRTTVLSLDTGHRRDYDEGEAYRHYFATDALMFPVPGDDARLRNKQEVLIPRFGKRGERPLAISSEFLRKTPAWHGRYGGRDFVVLTDRSGAHRIYALTDAQRVRRWDGDATVTDGSGVVWALTETALVSGDMQLPRLSSHNAFWFGWRAAHPDTELVAGEETRR
ncbi:MAG: DUF3179 domain-containing protein [Gemmatimonas sp.]